MTSINVTLQKNTVEVTELSKTTTVESKKTSVVQAVTAGPQGAVGLDLDETAKVDGSLVYYDASAQSFKADGVWTTETIVDGANF